MYQLHFKTPAPLRRSFATDVPRVDLDPGRHPVSGRLWAGMAAAAVVAAVSVGALSASVRPPAAETSTAAAPVVRADTALPVDPATDAGGSSDTGLAGVLPAGTVPAHAAPAAAAPAEAPPAAAPPAPPPPGPAAPSGDSNLYTVVPGDTVGAIAARFGVDLNGMLAANGLGTYSIILPGQTLKLSGPAVAAPPAPASAPAPPAQVTALVPAAPAVRTIYVAGSGGQSMLDACIGPIHYTPNDGYSLFITEHDFCGGWARFSGISVGETVSIPGYGTYTATARGQVPNPGTTNDVINVFGGFPRAILQTCIPGTSQMLLIALN
ncbi:LysM peptidoglycan-binding domain-containing protein [Arthrobacter sp. CDRTa11]|uniref:LysM peptidoglycan-binding domain-containing protein n=1 Tax=Arthrobacter sp. CDRTa11 TaxID=2651199 RepID=UPI002265BDF5|nr:LysM domain-containing protein [Arthrobacter sp. CDRTa11]UZX04239.1 LysM peptidoglycan-binding domain-containing protein [Arthrobacter sp. CDRTa11]